MSRTIEVSDAAYEQIERLASASRITPAEWVAAEVDRLAHLGHNGEPADTSISAQNGKTPTRVIELSDDVYARLEAEATSAGLSVAEWISVRAPDRPNAPHVSGTGQPQANGTGQPARTLADEFRGRTGLISSGRGDLSRRASELFAEGMVQKRRTGHL